nr:DDE-type integrase/transposase/recombinase [Bradyrhizobium mercantei]
MKKLGRFERVGHRITGDPSGPNKSRGAGWDFVHVCIDDHSRVAFSEIKPDETADSAVPFLKAAVTYYKSLGGTGMDQHAANCVFTPRAARKGWNYRDRAWRRLSRAR